MQKHPHNECNLLTVQRQALAHCIARWTETNHRLETCVAGLLLVRYEAPTGPTSGVYEPCICLVAQGATRVMLGDDEYVYDANHYLISSVGLPVVANVVEASPEVPLLGLALKHVLALLEMHTAHIWPAARICRAVAGSKRIVELVGDLVCIKVDRQLHPGFFIGHVFRFLSISISNF